jgi:hypothetical protein
MPSALSLIKRFAEALPHRGSTTPNEAQAAQHIRRLLREMGVRDIELQRFRSGVTLWRPYIVSLLLGLLAAAVYPLSGAPTHLLAALMSLSGLLSLYEELNFGDNWVRRILPKGDSQNVIGTIPCRGEQRAEVVLVGHLDSGQTPLLFRSQLGLLLFVILATLTAASFAVNTILYTLGAFIGDAALLDLEWIGSAVQAVGLVFAVQAELSPYTQGANDNASAVGVVLALARRLVETPLKHTRITALISGSEEVGCYGMLHYLAERETANDVNLREVRFINMEGVGCGRLHWAVSEGMLKPYRSHPELVRLVGEVAARRPDLGGQPIVLRAGYTETGVVVKRGLMGITLVGLEQGGAFKFLPYWHQQDDTLDKLEGQALDRTEEFVWEMLRDMDAKATPPPLTEPQSTPRKSARIRP